VGYESIELTLLTPAAIFTPTLPLMFVIAHTPIDAVDASSFALAQKPTPTPTPTPPLTLPPPTPTPILVRGA
jgi:hypothetical protein